MQRIAQLLNRSRLVMLLIALLLPTLAHAGMGTMSMRPPVGQFIKQMSKQYGFNEVELANLFNQVHLRPEIIRSFKRAKEGGTWKAYRSFFLTDKRINQGVQFWQQHEKTLALAQQKYGVPPSIIIAIIGVETQYGQNTGKYRVIDTLSTMAFIKNPRQKFFRSELENFLLLARDQGVSPLSIKGSYAGAIGLPQFMPSSYRTYAVSNHGKQADLVTDPDDAILSVANYFNKYGWQSGGLITIPASVKGDDYTKYLSKSFKPRYTVADLTAAGVKPSAFINKNDKAILIQFQAPDANEYWLGFNNFYVITGYNPSALYAMAVYQLADSIHKQKNKQQVALAPHVN